MNTDPNAKVILCYGDSNTFGQRSDDVNKGRWPADVRWTGQLQNLLGKGFYVIEEGLSSRTTDLEYTKPGRNGKTYLVSCLQSHNPIDTIVLMLGTNDFKTMYDRSVSEIGDAISGLIDDIESFSYTKTGSRPRIILVSPILVNDQAKNFAQLYSKNYDHQSAIKSQQLAKELAALAKKRGCDFVNAASVAEPGEDGIHFSKQSHANFAQAIAKLF